MRKTYRKDELFNWTPAAVATVWKLHREGKNTTEIAAVLKTTKNAVINQLRKPCPIDSAPTASTAAKRSVSAGNAAGG